MKAKQFNGIVDKQIIACREILITKAGQYASDEDRLHNFKIAAALEGCTYRQALAGFMAKHTVSIYDMCRNPAYFDMDLWDEKITDHLNYLFLLRAVVQDEWEDAEAEQAEVEQAEGTFPVFHHQAPQPTSHAFVTAKGMIVETT